MANQITNHWICDTCSADMGGTEPTKIMVRRPGKQARIYELCDACLAKLVQAVNLTFPPAG